MTRKVSNIHGVKIYASGNDDLETCRTCGHFRFLHIDQYPAYSDYLFDSKCDPQNDHGCDCNEYVPDDNLAYLEYLYDKKSKSTL